MKRLFIFAIPFLILSCATSRDDIQVFMVDKDELQYFIPNTEWKSEDISISVDFLYRDHALEGEEDSRTVANFSIRSKDDALIHKQILEALYLTDGGGREYELKEIKKLFAERDRIRYTSWISSQDFSSYMRSFEDPALKLIQSGGEHTLLPVNKDFERYGEYFIIVNPAP